MNYIFKNSIFILLFSISLSLKASVRSDFEEAADSLKIANNSLPAKEIKIQKVEITPEISYLYSPPKSFQWATAQPSGIANFFKTSFQKKNLWITGAVLGASAIMIVYDQEMLDGTQHFSRQIGISNENKQIAIIRWSVKIGSKSAYLPVYVPTNFNTSMYFLGDGLPHGLAVLGFWSYGKIKKDYRSLQTASQLLESMLMSGIIIQTMKHISGRESPFTSTAKGGVWRVFPNQLEYSKHVPHYDAFPSGHIATLISTITVIADNYPNNKYIKPVGYTLMGTLMFAMVNNGVHWVADYPLGIAIGYACAKIVTSKGHTVIDKELTPPTNSFLNKIKPNLVTPAFYKNTTGLSIYWSL
jgi:hypothetical protein